MTKTISLLGSTGSIGRQTLQVARELGLSVAALTANRQVDLLEQQAREFHPALAVLYDRDAARELRLRLSDTDIRVEAGPEGLLLAAQLPQADTVVTAVMGSVGLEPTLAAIRRKKRIALANKETLVCAGELVMSAARETGAEIAPGSWSWPKRSAAARTSSPWTPSTAPFSRASRAAGTAMKSGGCC